MEMGVITLDREALRFGYAAPKKTSGWSMNLVLLRVFPTITERLSNRPEVLDSLDRVFFYH